MVVGVNRFADSAAVAPTLLRVDPEIENRQRMKLMKMRASRHTSDVHAALNEVKYAAKTNENLMPPIIDAALKKATLGEIAQTLREVWGEYREAL